MMDGTRNEAVDDGPASLYQKPCPLYSDMKTFYGPRMECSRGRTAVSVRCQPASQCLLKSVIWIGGTLIESKTDLLTLARLGHSSQFVMRSSLGCQSDLRF